MNAVSGPDFFGDSFSKRVEDPIVHDMEFSVEEMDFSNKEDDRDDREALKMYQISFTGPQAIETVAWKQ